MDRVVPTARFTMTNYLAEDGEMMVCEYWENLTGEGEVPMVMKVGMLGMAQQSLVAESFGFDEEDDE